MLAARNTLLTDIEQISDCTHRAQNSADKTDN